VIYANQVECEAMESPEPTPDNDDSQSAVAQFIQSDEAIQTPLPESELTATPPEQPELVRLVIASLQARNYKPKCPQCSSIGWATTYIHPVPTVTQSLTGEIIPSALLVCGKCGAQREHNLNVLDITVHKPEPSRIVVP
jgi:hypothetical protein